MHDRCQLTERYFAADKQRHWPGTSKWNKIEHRLFCHITRTWRGRPLTSYEIVVNTIAATTTATGLRVTAVLDAGRYPVGAQVSDAQIKDLEDRVITRHGFHGDWNYTIGAVPRPAPDPGPRPAPPPPPPRPAADPAALDQPALTGLPPGTAATLAGALAETRLRAQRGGRDRQRPPTAGNHSRQKITFTGHILAAILHQRFALPARAIAALLGCDRSTIGHELPSTRRLLAATATAIPPGPRTLATYQDLRDYAAAAGITLPAPP
jgi:Rhodopirellula transposase DDE domain